MKTLRGDSIISSLTAQIVKTIVVAIGTFLWIESRMPSISSPKALVSPKQPGRIGDYSTQT